MAFHPDGSVTLNSGGWKTRTTKERINDNLPDRWRIRQKDSLWTLGLRGYPFADGITIHPDGSVSGQGPDPKETLKLKTRIKGYVAGFMSELLSRKIPKPGPADCWACLMKNDKGETVMGNDHLLSHLDENYYVPSLLMSAIKEIPISIIAREMVEEWLGYRPLTDSIWRRDIAKIQVAESLTRYMYRHLGMAA